jgi:hypothetical protein
MRERMLDADSKLIDIPEHSTFQSQYWEHQFMDCHVERTLPSFLHPYGYLRSWIIFILSFYYQILCMHLLQMLRSKDGSTSIIYKGLLRT